MSIIDVFGFLIKRFEFSSFTPSFCREYRDIPFIGCCVCEKVNRLLRSSLMKIITLFCKIDDFFSGLREMADDALSARDDTPGNTRTSSATASERSDDDPDCVPSKWVSDVQALLRKTRLRLLVRRVSTSGELFSVRST